MLCDPFHLKLATVCGYPEVGANFELDEIGYVMHQAEGDYRW